MTLSTSLHVVGVWTGGLVGGLASMVIFAFIISTITIVLNGLVRMLPGPELSAIQLLLFYFEIFVPTVVLGLLSYLFLKNRAPKFSKGYLVALVIFSSFFAIWLCQDYLAAKSINWANVGI